MYPCGGLAHGGGCGILPRPARRPSVVAHRPAARALDALVFSNLWVAGAAAALCAAAARGLEVAPRPAALGLAFAGTLAVYTADRLRDLETDRATAPARSAFVARHAGALRALAAAGAAAGLACGLLLGPTALAVAGLVLALAVLHPLAKRVPFAKTPVLTAAWLAVVVGLPAVAAPPGRAPGARELAWVAGVLGGALAANAVASSLRDREGGTRRVSRRTALASARALAAAGLGLALAGPAPVRPLAWIPAATLLAVAFWREGERYGLGVVDGALLAGALAALGGGAL